MFSMIFTLVMVIGILFLTWWITKKYALTVSGGSHTQYIRVIDRIAIAQDRFIILAGIGEKIYVIGVASGSITLLTEIEEDELKPLDDQRDTNLQGIDFKELLQKIGGKKHGQ